MPQGPRHQHGCTASASLQARLEGQGVGYGALGLETPRTALRTSELPGLGGGPAAPACLAPGRKDIHVMDGNLSIRSHGDEVHE